MRPLFARRSPRVARAGLLPLCWAAAGLAGCGLDPVEAPEEFGELTVFLYANFDEEGGASLIAGAAGMEALALDADLAGPADDRAVALPVLDGESFGGVSAPAGVDPQAQVPVAVPGLSRHGFAAHRGLIGEDNLVCIESSTTVYARRDFLTDVGCFVDGECDRVETFTEVRKETFVADVWYDLYKSYRIVALEDGRQAMYARTWMEDVFTADGGGATWDQYFGLEFWVEHPDDAAQVLHVYALWSSVTSSLLSDELYTAQIVNGIDEAYGFTDDFIDGELCGNDRDAEYERP